MIPAYRKKFNSAFTHKKYEEMLAQLTEDFEPISFRVAETPVFLPAEFVKKLSDAGRQIIELITQADFKTLTQGAIPSQWNVPNENGHPHFLTFDFAVCKDQQGELAPMLIEMQGFPSLYGFQSHLASTYIDAYDLDEIGEFTPYFNGMDKASYATLFSKVLIGPYLPEEVALMDIDASQQKTAIDFFITQRAFGIPVLSVSDIFQENNQLFYYKGAEKVRLRRIYNRLIFDEITDPEKTFSSAFDPRSELDIEWITHPNWFYRISKYTMPYLKGDFVPETRFLNKVHEIPADLENYVLKPLFSFAGQGVLIDLVPADLENVPDPENWILQRKVTYEPVVAALDGNVKVEVRLMYIWPDGEQPQLSINLVRLSRGKMIGVRYNKDFDWVGGTVGLLEK
mgnify:CR=1 FL=1